MLIGLNFNFDSPFVLVCGEGYVGLYISGHYVLLGIKIRQASRFREALECPSDIYENLEVDPQGYNCC